MFPGKMIFTKLELVFLNASKVFKNPGTKEMVKNDFLFCALLMTIAT